LHGGACEPPRQHRDREQGRARRLGTISTVLIQPHFNNLLAVLMMDLDILDGMTNPDSPAKELIDEARDVANSGAELTRRLLAFSRRQALNPQKVDLNVLIEGMIGLLRRTLGETIEVDTVTPPRLWRTMADPNQVENAILNLALNARDAMPDGGRCASRRSVRPARPDCRRWRTATMCA
ncbi:MAG: hypothetical protein HC861_01340, partial [Rhodospirillaceae bacterium]|nr:hypothetical protein [Rhodospirillaceae bacterium]